MNQDEDATSKLLLLFLAVFFLPAFLPSVRAAVRGWLLEKQVLVGAEASLLPVPFLDAGLDLRRLVVVAVLVVAGIWVVHARSSRTKEARRG